MTGTTLLDRVRRAFVGASLGVALLATPALAQEPQLVGEFRDWQVHEHSGQPAKICFATSQPKETSPRGISRSTAFFYVSAWPKDGVKAEVSVKLGFQAPGDSNVLVQIGSSRFNLFAKGDKAFVEDPRDELKLLDAMKAGSFMVVTANTTSGSRVKDTYSLIGVTAALNRIDGCG
ncbi:MAG: invasion associated locus B family protein [Pseudomonadota bacterium]